MTGISYIGLFPTDIEGGHHVFTSDVGDYHLEGEAFWVGMG